MLRVLSAGSRVALGGLLLLAGACRDFGAFHHATVDQAATPLAPGSCSARTALRSRESAPGEELVGVDPADVQAVRYPAGPGPMRGWWMRPEGAGPHPALVYFHGGFAWTPDEAAALRPWVARGFVVFMPALRGENGNPGTYELLCGEVDDAAAAVRWLAARPEVDPTRIATFGHSLGGGISALLALRADLPIAASGSAGGLYFEEVLQGWGPMLPFDPSDRAERQRRLLLAHLGELRRPHLAYMGTEDALAAVIAPARAKARELGAPLEVIEVPGDHRSSLGPALEAFAASAPLQALVRSDKKGAPRGRP